MVDVGPMTKGLGLPLTIEGLELMTLYPQSVCPHAGRSVPC